RGLSRISGNGAASIVFTPHLLPVRRGILQTMYLPLSSALTAADAAGVWSGSSAGERVVAVVGEGLAGLQDVVGRNVVALGFAPVVDVDAPTLLLVVALDNLVKGAAGQALQNANLMLGLDERDGLPC